MLSIGESLLYTTVRLEGTKANGQSSVGTGFFFGYESRLFVVTNKHVIEGIVDGRFIMNRHKSIDGSDEVPVPNHRLNVQFDHSKFVGHPDPTIDIAVLNLSSSLNDFKKMGWAPFYEWVSESIIPTEDDISRFVGPLEEIVFVGYPSGIWDSFNNLPIMRKGMTATPYYVDFMNEKKFLIDASVFPGSSGSPVFIYYAGSHADKEGVLYAGSKLFFPGIIAQVYQRKEEGQIVIKDIPTALTHLAEVNQMIDLGIVFKASAIIETIKHFLSIHPK